MWKLVQSGLSVVAGTQEPEYGPESIHPVCSAYLNGDKSIPLYSDLTRKDLSYQVPNHTSVETQTFYFIDDVYSGFAQVIHSNIIGLHTTAQFTFKLFKKITPDDYLWTSTKLDNFKIENGTDFYADGVSIVLNPELNEYNIKSEICSDNIVNLTVKRLSQGIKFGKDGTTYYGTDVENPWGSMRHVFWPRCSVEGTIKLKDGETITLQNGSTMYVMALQGMKPHHAAKSWNFLNYQSENYSVVLMEFTTPKSYNTTIVSVGVVIDKDGKVLFGSCDNQVETLETKKDEESGWLVPSNIKFTLNNGTQKVEVVGKLDKLSERVDVMAEIPQFVKNIVSGVAGTKPYIYQFSNELEFKLYDNDKLQVEETGYTYNEATFITES
ncbi:hypothetical protein CANARDRAFT_176262 [[Candida] arabinofermentans NRRL YB-2248]|uniref:Survival factor 1 n=1 Tax=[Candida] arabinofermentans NRRL YB-2248 TaxID=983967 RepID=A0A1E4T0P8_9ASCO|nr:hypothetical protein CANARDRAFT_176262 [[Candida] arabinofermentans NRRL YB-2248]